MNEKVKDSNYVKKRYNEEHISISKSKCDNKVTIKSDLELDFYIESVEELYLLCKMFNDYG